MLTKELFRVVFGNGSYMSLKSQVCTDSKPFYWVYESDLPYESCVDSAGEDLQFIIGYLERSVGFDSDRVSKFKSSDVEVIAIYNDIIRGQKDFLSKVRLVAAAAKAEESQPQHTTCQGS